MKRMFLLILLVSFVSCGGDDDENEPQVVETVPLLSTKPITNIEGHSASSGGNISSDGNNQILQKGICWSVNPNPTINANDFSIEGIGNQSYTSELTSLEFNTTYYVRAYATNSIGTAYGSQVSFTTSSDPSINQYTGNVHLQTQAQVDAFGSWNYTHITGSLEIGPTNFPSNGEIINIDALNTLSNIGGFLTIHNNNLLENITAFTNLISTGVLIIQNNYRLLNIEGLANLTNTGFVTISDNSSLINLNGLNSLQSIDIQLNIGNNSSLINIDGLNNLLTVGSNNSNSNIPGSVSIFSNVELTNLNGLSNLTSIDHNLYINHNQKLNDISGLSNLSYLGGDLSISYNHSIENLTGLELLSSLNENIKISNNFLLRDFCGIQSSNFAGLTGIYDVFGNAYNPTLQDLIDGNCSL